MEILSEFRDTEDNWLLWMVPENEKRGRVDVHRTDIDLKIKHRFTVEACQIRLILSMPTDAQTLAQEFSAALQSLLTREQMQSVILQNAAETQSNICHLHDFCDANVVMHEVFRTHGMDPADEGGMDQWGSLWDATRNLAKHRGFDVAWINRS